MALIKLNNRAVKDVTEFGSISSLGSMTFISKATASSSASIEFTSGIDSTYKEYVFYFYNIHLANDSDDFGWQANAVGETGYNETVTSTAFMDYHQENGSSGQIAYNTASDQAQGTGLIQLSQNTGNSADDNCSGYLHLFNPSSTTFVKHFIARVSANHATVSPGQIGLHTAGYINTTSAIDEIQFSARGGNIDSGEILLFGVN